MFSKKKFLILIAASILTLIILNLLPQTQKLSQSYLDKAFDRAFISFAVAKSLNAVISVAQGTQIAATPAGLGVVFAAGEALDPFNDMVERFSWVMLASTVSIGIQKILLTILSSCTIQYIFTGIGIMVLLMLALKNEKLFLQSFKIFLFLTILRFSVPIFALGNEAFYDAFLAPTYTHATQELQKTHESAKELLQEKEESSSWLDRVKEVFDDTLDTLNVKKHLETLKEDLEKSFKEILSLITLFIVQTILSPLLFLYLFYQLLKVIFRHSLDSFAFFKPLEKLIHTKEEKKHEPKY